MRSATQIVSMCVPRSMTDEFQQMSGLRKWHDVYSCLEISMHVNVKQLESSSKKKYVNQLSIIW